MASVLELHSLPIPASALFQFGSHVPSSEHHSSYMEIVLYAGKTVMNGKLPLCLSVYQSVCLSFFITCLLCFSDSFSLASLLSICPPSYLFSHLEKVHETKIMLKNKCSVPLKKAIDFDLSLSLHFNSAFHLRILNRFIKFGIIPVFRWGNWGYNWLVQRCTEYQHPSGIKSNHQIPPCMCIRSRIGGRLSGPPLHSNWSHQFVPHYGQLAT